MAYAQDAGRAARRTARKLRRTSRDVARKAEHAIDETGERTRLLAKTMHRSMRDHPVMWLSGALSAAALAGGLVFSRRDH